MNTENGLTPLPDPAPPISATGYTGDSRYVAFFWNHLTGAATWFDGLAADTAAWPVLMAYSEHVNGHNLGAVGTPAEHWLIIDREERKAYVAPVVTAWVFVHDQHTQPFPPETVREIVAAFEAAAGQIVSR